MNFKLSRLFYLAISCIIGGFFVIFGIFSIILSWSTYLQTITIQFILENFLVLSLIGLSFTLVGLSIIIYTFFKTRHHYIQIRIGNLGVILDENVVYQYLQAYWQKHFPKSHIPFSLNFKKHSLQIVADIPPLLLQEQKIFLEQVEHDFRDLFGSVLGYPYEVHFIANFSENKKQL